MWLVSKQTSRQYELLTQQNSFQAMDNQVKALSI